MTRRIRVLVADDERNLRELVVRELGRRGHEVDGVADGVTALERIAEGSYDVVVLDMKMPRKEGIEVLRELAATPESPQVLVMTGFQEVSTAVEAMKLGAYDYLTKPTKIEELDILVRKAAEKMSRGGAIQLERLGGVDPRPCGHLLHEFLDHHNVVEADLQVRLEKFQRSFSRSQSQVRSVVEKRLQSPDFVRTKAVLHIIP